jgi:hypothetical protein
MNVSRACAWKQSSFASRRPVTIGSRSGEWRVCWLGGWTKHRLSYLVMVVRTRGSAE